MPCGRTSRYAAVRRIGRTVVMAALSFGVLVGAADAAQPTLNVSSPLQTKWVSGGSHVVAAAGHTTNGTGMAIDAYVDGTLIGHVSCTCKDWGDPIFVKGVPTYTPAKIGDYDTRTQPDGSSHTLRVVLTEQPTGVQVSGTWVFNVDLSPPAVSAEGGLAWASGGYVDASPHNLTLNAYDGLSGAASVMWQVGSGRSGVAGNGCSPNSGCDYDLSFDFAAVTSSMVEGANSLRAIAYDGVGNSATYGPWTVYLDKTGPRAPSVSALRDPATGEAFLVWGDAGDPALPDGSPGSGTSRFHYQYSVNGAAWTAPADTDDLFASLGTVAAGTSVAVQVTAIDAVGNASGPTSTTVVVVDAPPVVTTSLEGFDDTTPSALQAQATALVTCVVRTTPSPDTDPFVTDLEGEPDAGIKGEIEGWCNPTDPTDPESVAASESATLRIGVCLQVEAGTAWRDLKCRAAKLTGTSSILHLNVSATELCEPGSPRYRLLAHTSVTEPGLVGAPGQRNGPTKPRALPCNEAGAWRRVAARDPGTSNQVLAAALRAPDSPDSLPQGDPSLGAQGGWEAHHIVPAGEGRGTEGTSTAASNLAQRYAYDCRVSPNRAENGVWLRGPHLRTIDPGYNKLTDAGKKRANHRSTGGVHSQNSTYYGYVANQLSVLVDEATDRCTSHTAAVNALDGIRGLLISGTVPG
jgi:A nuclease family of the HNH/ENDO VII superfamily with conserved AHH